MARSGVELHENMVVTFYDYDASEKSANDKLLFEGMVHYDGIQEKWYAMIVSSSFTHKSDEDVSAP